MDDRSSLLSHYAILIGINAYPGTPLKGCVRDVQDIRRYLEGLPCPVHIKMFTATKSDDPVSRGLIEDSQLWPTLENVTSGLKKLTSLAKAGDHVYIHYSGHGARMKAIEAPHLYSNRSTGDLALALLDEGKENNIKYLEGAVLASYLKEMVDKGLVVTLVLDCCFSASVYRHDGSRIRYLPYNADFHTITSTASEKRHQENAGHSENRDASMLPNWLINPDGYAILAACGPHEEAREINLVDGRIYGALSYFLLALIEGSGPGMKHKDIYNHLRAKFQELGSHKQNPVMYGNKDQAFFQLSSFKITSASIPITRKKDGSFLLHAGEAHGICDNDRFPLCPLSFSEYYLLPRGDPVIARVVHAGALTSDLELLEVMATPAKTGWVATGYPQTSLQKHFIQLGAGLSRPHELLAALEAHSLRCHTDDKHPYSLYISLQNNRQYDILDRSCEGSQKITNLPLMTQDETDVSYVSDVVEHLVKFKIVRELSNNVLGDTFQDSFSAQIISHSGGIYSPGRLIEVHEEMNCQLVVKNKGDKALYVYVYDLGPCWQITNILKGGYEVIPPGNEDLGFSGEFRRKFKTKIPFEMTERGFHQCEDVIKVFVTSQATSFDLFELPKLSELKTSRSVKEVTANRSSGDDRGDLSENWAAVDFPIRTFVK